MLLSWVDLCSPQTSLYIDILISDNSDNLLGSYSTFLKVYFERNFFFFFFFATPGGIQDINSPTRDQTCMPCSGSRVLTTEPPGKPLNIINSGKHLAIPSAYKLLVLVLGVGEPKMEKHGPCYPEFTVKYGS